MLGQEITMIAGSCGGGSIYPGYKNEGVIDTYIIVGEYREDIPQLPATSPFFLLSFFMLGVYSCGRCAEIAQEPPANIPPAMGRVQ